MYIQNRRDSSIFKACSPLQHHNGLISLKPAIAYFAYTCPLCARLSVILANQQKNASFNFITKDMYDRFKPYQLVKLTDFTFEPTRFEVWQKGQMINSGETKCSISMKMLQPSEINPSCIKANFENNNISEEIESESAFDFIFTMSDRIMMTTISKTSNIDSYDDYWVFKSSFPSNFQFPTRNTMQYEKNQPFACALFLSNQKLKQLAFYLGASQKLVRFYE